MLAAQFFFSTNIVFFCLKIFLTFANSVDPEEMQQYAAFHLGPHCLQKYLFRCFPEYKGLINSIIQEYLNKILYVFVLPYRYGPREVLKKEEFSMKGQLSCEFKFATFSCQNRRSHQQDGEEKDFSVQLLEALEPAVCLVSIMP